MRRSWFESIRAGYTKDFLLKVHQKEKPTRPEIESEPHLLNDGPVHFSLNLSLSLIEGTVTAKVLSFRKRREKERQDRRKPAVQRTNLIRAGNRARELALERQTRYSPSWAGFDSQYCVQPWFPITWFTRCHEVDVPGLTLSVSSDRRVSGLARSSC
jgi:hypothetical protein